MKWIASHCRLCLEFEWTKKEIVDAKHNSYELIFTICIEIVWNPLMRFILLQVAGRAKQFSIYIASTAQLWTELLFNLWADCVVPYNYYVYDYYIERNGNWFLFSFI